MQLQLLPDNWKLNVESQAEHIVPVGSHDEHPVIVVLQAVQTFPTGKYPAEQLKHDSVPELSTHDAQSGSIVEQGTHN